MIINFDHPDAITRGSSRKINLPSGLIGNMLVDVAGTIKHKKIETSTSNLTPVL
jgi:hypothetical protein